ncbi:MAG: hypothetical protein QM711_06045 [Micropruina sp.]|uniref:hypothetical protein n=1 Tax=Micropruina sp. TaxID=2737536 RepID=UPI0039E49C71
MSTYRMADPVEVGRKIDLLKIMPKHPLLELRELVQEGPRPLRAFFGFNDGARYLLERGVADCVGGEVRVGDDWARALRIWDNNRTSAGARR